MTIYTNSSYPKAEIFEVQYPVGLYEWSYRYDGIEKRISVSNKSFADFCEEIQATHFAQLYLEDEQNRISE